MGQGKSIEADTRSNELLDSIRVVQAELKAGHLAYLGLQCFQRVINMIENPDECDLVRLGWVAFCQEMHKTAECADRMFDGGRVEELGLARLRDMVDMRTDVGYTTLLDNLTTSPIIIIEDALRGLRPWTKRLAEAMRMDGPPGRCLRSVDDLLRSLKAMADKPYWRRIVKPFLQRSIIGLAEGIAIFAEAVTCMSTTRVDLPPSAAWSAARSATGVARSAARGAKDGLVKAGSGLFTLAYLVPRGVVQGVVQGATYTRDAISTARDRRNEARLNEILREYKIDDGDWSDEEDLCKEAERKGALGALRAEGYCLEGGLAGGDSPDLLRRVRGCAAKVKTQDGLTTPMDLGLLHDLFGELEEAFGVDAPDRAIKLASSDVLANLAGVVPGDALAVERPRPPRPGARVRFL